MGLSLAQADIHWFRNVTWLPSNATFTWGRDAIYYLVLFQEEISPAFISRLGATREEMGRRILEGERRNYGAG